MVGKGALVHANVLRVILLYYQHFSDSQAQNTATEPANTADLVSIPFPNISCPLPLSIADCSTKANLGCEMTAPCKTSNSSGHCPSYSRDCYCNLPNALACVWSCDWLSYMLVEDWFEGICGPRPVDFTDIPTCAKECVQNKMWDYGCTTMEKNCFCLHGSIFGCENEAGCEGKADAILAWFEGVCSVTDEEGKEAIGGGSDKDAKLSASGRHRRLRWYELWIIVVLAISGASYLILYAWVANKTHNWQKKGAK